MNLWKKIKLLPDAIKGQLFNDPNTNGEYKYLEKLLSNNDRLVIFDVGANTGYYSEKILSINPNVFIYCFEPVSSTFSKLQSRLSKFSNVTLQNYALGEIEKEAEIFVYDDEAGSNSLYYDERYITNSQNIKKEKILVRTLDNVIKELSIPKIDFLKLDVEANEINVLKGVTNSLTAGIIKIIQFEYSDYWKKSSSRLEDAFSILITRNYKFYRLTPWGKVPIYDFKAKLENYKHSNYLAILDV